MRGAYTNYQGKPVENGAEYRHDAEHYGEEDTEQITDLEVFASSAGVLVSIKIYGIPQSVTHINNGYYIVTADGDYFYTFIKQDANGLRFVDVQEAEEHFLLVTYEAAQERMLRLRKPPQAES